MKNRKQLRRNNNSIGNSNRKRAGDTYGHCMDSTLGKAYQANYVLTKGGFSARQREETRSRFLFAASLFLGAAAVLFFLFFFCLRDTSVNAQEPLSDMKYKVVEIQAGDSLWSVASDNMNPGFSDIYEYIHEIKRCNKLTSNQITSGAYLVVPYYEYE